jgi:hypothetical protein
MGIPVRYVRALSNIPTEAAQSNNAGLKNILRGSLSALTAPTHRSALTRFFKQTMLPPERDP